MGHFRLDIIVSDSISFQEFVFEIRISHNLNLKGIILRIKIQYIIQPVINHTDGANNRNFRRYLIQKK